MTTDLAATLRQIRDEAFAPPPPVKPQETKPPPWQRSFEELTSNLREKVTVVLPEPARPAAAGWRSALQSVWVDLRVTQATPQLPAAEPVSPSTNFSWLEALQADWRSRRQTAKSANQEIEINYPGAAIWDEELLTLQEDLQWFLLDLPVSSLSLRADQRRIQVEQAAMPAPDWIRWLRYLAGQLRLPVETPEPVAPRPAEWAKNFRDLLAYLRARRQVRNYIAPDAKGDVARFAHLPIWHQELLRSTWLLRESVKPEVNNNHLALTQPAMPAWERALKIMHRRAFRSAGVKIHKVTVPEAVAPTATPRVAMTPDILDQALKALRRDEGLYDAIRRSSHEAPTRRWREQLEERGLRPKPIQKLRDKGRQNRKSGGGWSWREDRQARIRNQSSRTGPGWTHCLRPATTPEREEVVERRKKWYSRQEERVVVTKTTWFLEYHELRLRPQALAAEVEQQEKKEIRLGLKFTGALRRPRWMNEEEWTFRQGNQAELLGLLETEMDQVKDTWGNPDLRRKFS